MNDHEPDYVYEPFADTPEYLDVNRSIIREWIDALVAAGSKGVSSLLDLGSGVGTMVQLFVQNLPREWPQPSVTCVDLCGEALEHAKRRLAPLVRSLRVMKSPVEKLETARTYDVAMWGNGIHYLEESQLRIAMTKVRDALKDGGWFFFNSAFTEESRPAETMPFYRAQIHRAMRHLRSLGVEREKRRAAPESSRFLPAQHYEAVLKDVGFAVEAMQTTAVRLYQTAWEHISGFAQYASGALHGYPADLAGAAMRESVGPAIEEYGQRDEENRPFISRRWLSGIARSRTS
ncbi:MAG: class I SAM-dependent methyltransferase [Spirochaetota bacterium]